LPWQVGHGIEVGTADTRTIVPVTGDDPYEHKGITDTPGVTFVRARVATPENESHNTGSHNAEPAAGSEATPDHDGLALRIDTGITIDATVTDVWTVLTDLDRYADWNPYIVQAQGAGTAGSTVTVTTRSTGADREFTYDVDVVSVDAPRRLEWEGGSPDRTEFLTRHVWTLTETPDGTDLHHYETFHGTEAQTTFDRLKGGLRRDFDRFNAGLKDACETADRPA
jgi:uncharacterized protein YndB with AHSA1/START domain